MTEPAYIGEGPEDATGGSSATGGSGAATGGGGSSRGPIPMGGTDSAAGTSGTGLPGVGGGGGLPPSGSCRVTAPGPYANMTSTWVSAWDAEQRTFRIDEGGDWYARLDEHGWLVEISQAPESQFLFHHDGQGNLTELNLVWEGVENAAESWDQMNGYDADGRLASSLRVYHDGVYRKTETFDYSGSLLIGRETEWDGGPEGLLRGWNRFVHEGGRIVHFDSLRDGVVVSSRFTASYDAAGRLRQVEWDYGAETIGIDGVIDERERWFYDEAGRVARYEADGLDFMLADGVVDEWVLYEPACADIAVLPEFLYNMPEWLMPYARHGWNY